MSIKKIMHKDRHGAQVSIEFGEGGPAAQLVEQFLGGMGVPAMQDIPQEHPGNPKGTDTVPAWLTPGEFVMNAEATRMFEPQIEEMNNAGRAVQREQGGSIPEYKAAGGSVGEDDLVMQALRLGVSPEELSQSLRNQSPQYKDAIPVTRNIPVEREMTADLTGTGYRSLLDRTEGSGPVSALVQGGLDVGNNIAAGVKRASNYLGGTNVPPSAATLAVDERADAQDTQDARFQEWSKTPAGRNWEASQEQSKGSQWMSNIVDNMGDMSDVAGLRSTEKMLSFLTKERAKLTAGLVSGNLNPAYVEKAIADIDKRYAGVEASAVNGENVKFNKVKNDIEGKAQRLIDNGYLEEGNALLATVPPSPQLNDVPPPKESEPNDDEATVAGLLDAGKKAKTLTPDVADQPTAWDKVKDFFEEGFSTVLDKGALSEAATIYLGSRALGYDHEGSLNFVAKRYGKGIEDKLAIANKAVGTHTPESITKYKDTGNLNDLVLIKTLTYTNETEYWTDPKTGDEITLRVAKDEKDGKVLVDPDDNPVDTKNFLKASEFKSRDEYNQKQIKSIMSPKLRKFELDNDMPKGEGEAIINIPEVAQAMSMYSIQNGFNTAKVNELSDYVFNSILETRSDAKNKKMSDRDLTNLALQKGIARQMEKDMFVKPNGNPVEPTVTGEILALMDGLPKDPVPQGQMLKTMFHHGYMTRTPDERKRFTMDAKGRTSGYLEYLRQQGYIADRDNWVPAWRSLNGQ